MISSFLSWFFVPRNYVFDVKPILHHMSQQAERTNAALLLLSSDLEELFESPSPPQSKKIKRGLLFQRCGQTR